MHSKLFTVRLLHCCAVPSDAAQLAGLIGAVHAQVHVAMRNSTPPCCIAWQCPVGCLAGWSHRVSVQVQVIVATAPMCWGMSIAAHLVVIMGTQYYDGAHSQGADDYPVTDLLQMMGRASRPDIDDSGK